MADNPDNSAPEASGDQPEVYPQLVPNPAAETGVYTTTTLIEGLRYRFAVPSFLRDTFFAGRDYVNTDAVQIDTYRGGRGLAPFILPLEGQVVGRRLPYKTSFVEAPIIAPAREITLRDLGRPGWGETQYNFKSPEERFATYIANDTTDMDDEIARTEEYMCAGVMCDGKIIINYRNKTSVTVDYGFTNKTILGTQWSTAGSDPLADLRAAQQSLNANGYSGNMAIYSPEAWNALWANQKVIDSMKSVAPQFAPISGVGFPERPPSGVAQGPSFTNPVMQNWVYSGSYVKGGVVTPYIPKGYVIVGSSEVKNRLIYAKVTQIEQDDGRFHTYMLDRVPKMECNVNRNFFLYTLTARPMPVPVDLLCWQVITNTVP
jgi:Phage major capsid protein E